MRTAALMCAMLAAHAAIGRPQGTGASWLDEPKPASWNRPGLTIPDAPKGEGTVDARCRELARPPQTDEDRRVRDHGWDLVGAFQGGWQMLAIGGTAGYDGMCRPRQYQHFVFVHGVFAGTLAPQPMDSRTDGALSRDVLQDKNRLIAEYLRYTPGDALCCPSRRASVVFDITRENAVVTAVTVSTGKL